MLSAGIGVILWARPSCISVRMAWLTAGLVIAAASEYCISSLADSEETFRHLFLFHALTDVTVCMALAAVLSGTLRFGRTGVPACPNLLHRSNTDDPTATATPARRAATHK